MPDSNPSLKTDECFAYDRLKPNTSNTLDYQYGMFKESCYKKVELNKHDVLYSRVVKVKTIGLIHKIYFLLIQKIVWIG